jgi:hypothetical protein
VLLSLTTSGSLSIYINFKYKTNLPVADMMLSGCPENNENNIPQIEPAKMHSMVALEKNCLFFFIEFSMRHQQNRDVI